MNYEKHVAECPVVVIINEQHSLLPEQEKILNDQFAGRWEKKLVPTKGWNKEERDQVCKSLDEKIVIFASPIPGMIARCSYSSGAWLGSLDQINYAPDDIFIYKTLVFSNDTREKKELPGGKIIHVVAKTGWYLE
jgi:hypothetical protein